MKKLLVLAVLFLGGITAQANTVTDLDHNQQKGIRYNQSQPVTFVQRGIQFFVYTNGEFDFKLPRAHFYGRRGNSNYNAPGTTYGVRYPYRSNRLVRYDHWGNVKQIGRNHIYYNRRGKVNRIGSINLRYRNGRLHSVGNMFVNYDRWGRIIGLDGYISNHHTACGICGINGCTTNHFDYNNNGHNHGWDFNWGDDDNHHFEDYGRRKNKNKGKRKRF